MKNKLVSQGTTTSKTTYIDVVEPAATKLLLFKMMNESAASLASEKNGVMVVFFPYKL